MPWSTIPNHWSCERSYAPTNRVNTEILLLTICYFGEKTTFFSSILTQFFPPISGNENEVVAPSKNKKKPSRSRSRTNTSSKTNNLEDESKDSSRRTTRRKATTQRPVTKETVQHSTARTTTPPPPTTPDPGADFKCEDEGFYPNPRDCKKYFWCLDSGPSNLGIVAHQFTCPSGLIFNQATDSCDYARNVVCAKTTTTTTTTMS